MTFTHPDKQAIQAARDAVDRWYEHRASFSKLTEKGRAEYFQSALDVMTGHFVTIHALLDAALAGQAEVSVQANDSAPEVGETSLDREEALTWLSGMKPGDKFYPSQDRKRLTSIHFLSAPIKQPPQSREPGEVGKAIRRAMMKLSSEYVGPECELQRRRNAYNILEAALFATPDPEPTTTFDVENLRNHMRIIIDGIRPNQTNWHVVDRFIDHLTAIRLLPSGEPADEREE